MKRTGAIAVCRGLLFLSVIALVPAPARPPTVVVFGDSTTAAVAEHPVYAQLLASELSRRVGLPVNVINAGVRGNTTVDAAARWDRDVRELAPDVLVIQFGINDATIDVWKKPPATAPRVALQDFSANLRRFVREARAHGAHVVLMTPNPLSWTSRLVELYGHAPYDSTDPHGLNLNLTRYAHTVRELAASEGVTLVDVWAVHEAWSRDHQEPLLSDGIHPNARGHELVARELVAAILRAHVTGFIEH